MANDPVIPRSALIAAGLLMGLTTVAAGVSARFGAHGTPDRSTMLASRDFTVIDRSDGSVAVIATTDRSTIDVLAPGTNGFLRSTMRGLARERRIEHADDAAPFRLTAWADGRLTLDDATTRRRIDLEAFGPTNANAFARLLPHGDAVR